MGQLHSDPNVWRSRRRNHHGEICALPQQAGQHNSQSVWLYPVGSRLTWLWRALLRLSCRDPYMRQSLIPVITWVMLIRAARRHSRVTEAFMPQSERRLHKMRGICQRICCPSLCRPRAFSVYMVANVTGEGRVCMCVYGGEVLWIFSVSLTSYSP